MLLSDKQAVRRNSERFRHRTLQTYAFGGTALRSALRAGVYAYAGPIALATILAAPQVAWGRDAETLSDAPTSAYLETVQIVGHWREGHRDGFVRLAISGGGTEHYKNQAWLQWIEQKHNDRILDELIATREISEVSGTTVFRPVAINPKRGTQLTLEGTHAHALCTFRLRVAWTSPGKYRASFLQSERSKSDCIVKGNRIVGIKE